ncbi:MAG: carboxylesterase family protein [Pseudomonadota bacterium]
MTVLARLLGLALVVTGSTALAQAPIVDAPAGKARGTTDGTIRVFKGLPYARPPVRGLRWRPPVPLTRWSGERAASDFGPACVQPQVKSASVYSNDPIPVSEDCLTLNIWTPANAKNAPVLFWIHGGALLTGASREPVYDGRKLAERGVIVVSINYRLGVLGWLAHPSLTSESPQKISGNYGLLDQIAALTWVRNNIAAFGGDVRNVTIAGESAGALSTLYLLSSPAARGLFQRAIAQSGYMVSMAELRKSVFGAPSGEALGQLVAGGLQAPDLAAMRAMDAQQITDTSAKLGFAPFGVVDGLVLPQQMVDTFDQGKQAPVPVLAGFNQGEIRTLMMLAAKPPATAADYEKQIRERYGDLADAFLKLYPAADYRDSVLATPRDALYGWTSQRLARKQAALGVRSYLYLFDHGYPAMDQAGLHAFHAAELPYVFGTADRTPPNWPKIPATGQERALSDAMLDYWASFARDGTPVAAKAPAWPTYDTSGSFMLFGATPEVRTALMPGMFEFNETVMCRRRADGKNGWNWNVGLNAQKLPPKIAGCN